MPTNATTPDPMAGGLGETEQAKSALKSAAKHAERSFVDAAEQTRERLADAAQRTQAAVRDGLDTLRAQTRAYADTAGQQLDTAQRYVVERVKERPVTATLAGVGVGVLIGLLLASRGGRR
ncbi:MAG: hypothetical protein ACOY4K_02920 [Pseudomonadota bacterium]